MAGTDLLPTPDQGFLQETPDGNVEFATSFRGGFGAGRPMPAEATTPGIQVADASDAWMELEALSKGNLESDYRDTLSRRESGADLKWLEDYATNNGLGEIEDGLGEQPQQPSALDSGNPLLARNPLLNPMVTEGAGAIIGDVAGTLHPSNIAGMVVGGGASGVQNTINGILSATGWLADWVNKTGAGLPGGLQITDPETGVFDPKLLSTEGYQKFQEAGGSSDISIPGSDMEVDTVTGQLGRSMVQFLTSLGMVGKVTGGLGGGLLKRVGQYGLADLAAWDGQEGNLANLIEQFPSLQNPITEFLATDEETPELEGRVKNALSAIPLNVGSEVLFQWLKGVKEVRRLKELTGSQSMPEAAAKVEALGGIPGRPTVDQILGDPSAPLVQRAERIISPIEPGVPDDVAAKSLLLGSHKAPDIEPGKKRLYTVLKDGAEVGPETDDLAQAQAFIKEAGGTQGETHQIAYRDVPPSGADAAPKGPPFSEDVYVNWARIDTPDDVKRAIGMMADSFSDDIAKAQRGVVTNAETAALAGDENAWKLLLGERTGNLPNAHEQLAMRRLWASSGEKLLETAKLAATGGDAEMYAFRRMMEVHNAIQREVIGVRTETARALQQWRMPAGPEQNQLQQIKMLLEMQGGGVDVTRDLAQKVALLAGDPAKLDHFARKGVTAKTLSAVREYWINALLSGPKTHIVNAMSNSLVFANNLVERMIGGQISSVMSPVDGVKKGEALYMIMGAKESFRDALSAAWKVMKTGQSHYARDLGIPGHELSSGSFRPAISAEALEVKNNHIARGIDILGSIIRTPGTAMLAADDFFKTINARSEIYAQALRMASSEVERGKLPKEALKTRIAEIVDNPPDDIKLHAADMAAYNTFTSEPDVVTKQIIELRNKIPGAVILLPFINTPANILKFSFERTPLAPLVGRFRADIAAGGARRDLAIAKLGLGTIVMSVAYDLAMDGHVTGSGPAGDKHSSERGALARGGWQKYSARFISGQDADGNPTYRYFAYNRMDPVGLYFGMAADIADMARNMDWEDASARQTFEQIAVAATFAAAEGMMDKTYLSGFASFIDAIRDPDRAAYSYVRRLTGSMVPAVVAEGARQIDPYAKHTTDMISQLQSRVPYLSEGVPPRLNMWGEPIGYQSGLGMAYDTVSPIYTRTTEKTEPIDREFFRLNYFPSDSVTMPMKGEEDGKSISLSLRNRPDVVNDFKLAAGKTPASRLLEDNEMDMRDRKGVYRSYVNTLFEMGDRTMKEALNDLVTGRLDMLSLDYEAGSAEDKVEMISRIMRAYRGAARVEVQRKYPDLQEMRDRIPSKYGRGEDAPF